MGPQTDNAIVNVPLAKRGDLAAMAERSVRAEEAAFRARVKAARLSHREMFAKAREMIAAMSDERMAELGAPHKLTARQTRMQFVSAARSNPARVIASMSKEVA